MSEVYLGFSSMCRLDPAGDTSLNLLLWFATKWDGNKLLYAGNSFIKHAFICVRVLNRAPFFPEVMLCEESMNEISLSSWCPV